MLQRLSVELLLHVAVVQGGSLRVQAEAQIGEHDGVGTVNLDGLLERLDGAVPVGVVASHVGGIHLRLSLQSPCGGVVGVGGDLLLDEGVELIGHVQVRVHVAEGTESELVVGLLLVEFLQHADILQRVLAGLQVALSQRILEGQGLLANLGIVESQFDVLLGKLILLGLVGIAGGVVSHLTHESLLGSLVDGSKQRSIVGIEESTPVLQHTILVALAGKLVTCVDKNLTGVEHLLRVGLAELGFHLAFGIGKLVVFVALYGIYQSVVSSVVHAKRVKLLHLRLAELGHSVGCLHVLLLGEFLHSKRNQVVVSPGLLGVIGKLPQG